MPIAGHCIDIDGFFWHDPGECTEMPNHREGESRECCRKKDAG